jgi:RNA-directed DNA polymerase
MASGSGVKSVRSKVGASVPSWPLSALVFDRRVQRSRHKQAHGDVIVVRFSDDFVVGFQHRIEAERFLAAPSERFTSLWLGAAYEKACLIEFGRYAWQNRQIRGDGRAPATFNFLGFMHSWGKTRKRGFTVLRQTMRSRWAGKIE